MHDATPGRRRALADLIDSPDGGPIQAELFVRSLAPFGTHATQDRLVERLEGLRGDGRIESFAVRVWGEAVRTEGRAPTAGDEATVVDRIVEFFATAADAEWSLGRYFRVRTDGSLVDDHSRDRVVPPQRCLSIRRADDLRAVFPCDVGDEQFTPADALSYLEVNAGEVPAHRTATGVQEPTSADNRS